MKALQRADKTLGLAACVALQPLKLVRERPVESPAKKDPTLIAVPTSSAMTTPPHPKPLA